jgi:membrane-associated phospholipid phosphatase
MAALYRTLLLGIIASILIFTFFPQIDLATTRLFYTAGEGFPLSRLGWVDGVRRLHMSMAWAVGGGALVLWLALGLQNWRRNPFSDLMIWLQDKGGRPGARLFNALRGAGHLLARSGLLDLAPRRVFYVLICLLVGPGLLVNVVLKDHWGRARPSQVTEFGGTRTFTPALSLSDQCPRNCSFVSGEVSLGFWWLSFAFAVPPGRRRQLLVGAALAMGAFIGGLRVAGGGHFLSDAIFSGLMTITVCAVLGELMGVQARAPAVRSARPTI